MKHRISLTLVILAMTFVAGVVLASQQSSSPPTPPTQQVQSPVQSPAQLPPIRVDEADALRIQVAYANLENTMLRVEKRYKVPENYAYNFAAHWYEPQALSQAVTQAPSLTPPIATKPK